MLIIILYVLIISLYTDHKYLLYQKIYICKNGNTTFIKSDYCNIEYLIISYNLMHLIPRVHFFGLNPY